MFEQVAGRSNIMRRCLSRRVASQRGSILSATFASSLYHFRNAYYRNFGSWIVGSRARRVKHNLTWTVFISWNSGLLDSFRV